MNTQHSTTLGVIVGNRGVFPGHLIKTGREIILRVLAEEGIKAVALSPEDTQHGGVQNLDEARKCGELLKQHADELDGILVTLPNFGDEKAVANALRYSGLNLPVLVHAFNDDPANMTPENRRDSLCGKLSVCNNLGQYGIRFSLTDLHTVDPTHESFRKDLHRFVSICKVVKGLRGARVGAIGARPTAFNTVRYSEKLFECNGISVETLDLSEVMGNIARLSDSDPAVKAKRDEIMAYAQTRGVPEAAMSKMAKMGVFIDRWMADNALQMTAVQCWTALEEFLGIAPCTVMSMMSNKLMSSACETDVAGSVSMYAMALASGKPSMLLDWNNNYGEDPNKVVVFHCSNLPQQVFTDIPVITFSDIFASSVGQDNAYGTLFGRIKAEPFTFCRVSSDDLNGRLKAYVGEGVFTGDPLSTFGGYGVAEVPNFQALMHYICDHHFEHHVAANQTLVARAVHEALDKYLGWSTYYHH